MRRTSASIDVTYSEQSSSDETLHCNNSKVIKFNKHSIDFLNMN